MSAIQQGRVITFNELVDGNQQSEAGSNAKVIGMGISYFSESSDSILYFVNSSVLTVGEDFNCGIVFENVPSAS